MIQAKSRAEAIEWAKKVPFVDGEIEIRQVFELEDFDQSDALETHRLLRDKLAKKWKIDGRPQSARKTFSGSSRDAR